MEIFHSNVRIGKDEGGLYFLIPFTEGTPEKVYMEEFFEEYLEDPSPLDISVKPSSPPLKGSSRYEEIMNKKERERLKKELGLLPRYPHISDDLNIHKHLERYRERHPPTLQFNVRTIEEHRKWAEKVRRLVKDLAHYEMERVEVEVEEIKKSEWRDLIFQKLYIKTSKDLKAPAILIRPKKIQHPLPAVIALHGHNYGKINSIGLERSLSDSYYGLELAQRGFVTLSLDQWGWGEREGRTHKLKSNTEKSLAMIAQLLGFTAIGIRSWEVSRSIDYLQNLDYVLPDKIGIIGQSGGGTTSAFAFALDERIHASVISGYFCSWKYSIFSIYHCPCNYIPGIMNWVDISDIVGIRAPSPVFIVAGEKDPIFPKRGVEEAYSKLYKIYELYGKTENIGIDIIPRAGHAFRGEHAYKFLEEHLKDH